MLGLPPKEEYWNNGLFVNYNYDTNKLIQYINHRKIKVQTKVHIDKHLACIVWNTESNEKISPDQLLQNPDLSPYHYFRLQHSDTNYPIIVHATSGDVINGYHRLAKAKLLDLQELIADIVTQDELDSVYIGYNAIDAHCMKWIKFALRRVVIGGILGITTCFLFNYLK